MDYWEKRYKNGGNSGDGSYGDYAIHKALIVNGYIKSHNIKTICELGCGDGNQLYLFNGYEKYYGYDISPHIIESNRKKNNNDKIIFVDKINMLPASVDLALSLDVIYHIIDLDICTQSLCQLFKLSHNFVIIFSSDCENDSASKHIVHRKFTDFVSTNISGFSLLDVIDNQLNTWAKFFIYKKDLVCC